MPAPTAVHEVFRIERRFRSAPSKVFGAFADPEVKRRWFAPEAGSASSFEADFRVGGRESSSFVASAPDFGPAEIRNHTVYLDIAKDQRIVFAYSMSNAEVPFSASLVTITLEEVGGSTLLRFTEQAVFFDGADGAGMREEGWTALLERLAAVLGEEASPGGWQAN